MRLKTLSRILAFGILLNNISINSFAGILSDDTRYETFMENNITINDILEEDNTDIKIEGNTLVNLVQNRENKLFCRSGNNHINLNIDGDCATYKTVENTSSYITINTGAHNLMKSDTTYTIFFTIYENQITDYNGLSIRGTSDAFYGNYPDTLYFNSGYKLTKGTHSIAFTTPMDISDYIGLGIGFKNLNSSVNADLEFKIGDIMLIEGDYSSTDINYFIGIQSSFENNLVTQEMVDSGEEKAENLGKYKVKYKSTGKNKLNINMTETKVVNGVTITYNDDKTITLNGVATNGFGINITTEDVKYDMSKKYIACVNVISGSCTGYTDGESWGLLFYTQNGFNPQISSFSSYAELFYPNTESYKPYLWVGYDGDAETSSTFDNFTFSLQIVESSVKDTSYEPYIESINTFYLNSPLLEGDTIEIINGQAYHVRRSKEDILDGSEYWVEGVYSQNQGNTMYFASTKYDKIINRGDVISDRFISNTTWGTDSESIYSEHGADNDYKLRIRINKSKLQVEDANGFKQWLQKNPTTVIYQLADQIYEPIKADLSVPLFEGTTYISNNSNVPASMEITVDRVLNRAVEVIELAKTNPTVENLSLARMWTNLLRETINKDKLQNQINNITKVEDLQIVKKTITSNMDIYIKPLNSLSISLSTNQIVFEDYSSVSDLDMDNALQITVNSSLPYQLNSYLETEIQNSSGDSKINKDLLHIKDDTESEYKQFLGLNQKLVLKEDCEAGSNNIHNIDLRLKASAHDADIYKAVIKFEAEQK